MEVSLPRPGTYVVAVSGGVDSVVLLNLLINYAKKRTGTNLVVAHLDHGIRPDSKGDRLLVEQLAKTNNLPFEYREANLGPKTNEASSRKARYLFLESVRIKYAAQGIITAHHQDDLLETAIINLIRGSGRKGLSSLSDREGILRPLLNYPKAELIRYAKDHKLNWHEDSTNQDTTYLRNYVRHNILPKLGAKGRAELLKNINVISKTNNQLDSVLSKVLSAQPDKNTLDRQWFNSLPHSVAKEIMAAWLRIQGLRDFDRRTIERLTANLKTAKSGQRFAALNNCYVKVDREVLSLVHQTAKTAKLRYN